MREGRLLTPNIGHILQDITRKSILAAAKTMGIETFADALQEGLLNGADEIFFSGTVHRVLPVSRVGDRILPAAPGQLTKMIAAKMTAIASGRDQRFQDWLSPV